MRDNPQRVAWTVLLIAFATFCSLIILVPLSVRWYLLNAMDEEVTAVTSVHGTVLAETRKASLPIPITDGSTIEVEEGTSISTDSTSQTILTFFNDSTLTLYGETTARIRVTRSPRFGMSRQPDTIIVELDSGRVRAAPSDRSDLEGGSRLRFEVHSPHTVINLNEGSFSVEVNDEETQVTARVGQARLTASDQMVRLKSGERSVAKAGEPPSPPLPAEKNLLVNGDFSAPLDGAWEPYQVEAPGGVVTITVKTVDTGTQPALQFLSTGKDNIHSEIGIVQQIDRSVQDFDSLRVQLDVRLYQQSLAGGGTLGSEFPLMVHLAYEDADGNHRDWYHGFHFARPPDNWILYDTPDNSSTRTVRFLWYPYESDNLLDTLGTAKPVHLKYIRLYGSGWLYDAYVTNVTLLAQD